MIDRGNFNQRWHIILNAEIGRLTREEPHLSEGEILARARDKADRTTPVEEHELPR